MLMERTETHAAPADRLLELSQAAAAIAQAPTVDAALRVLTERVRVIVGAHQAVTILPLADGDANVVTAASFSEKYGLHEYRTPPLDETFWEWLARQGGVVRLTDAELDTHELRARFRAVEPPLRGWLASPLTTRDGGLLGLVQLSDRYRGDFDAHDEAVLLQLAQLGSALIENVRLVEQTQRARAEADTANRAKSDFLATMSHEIRTPINAVMGYTELLEIGVSGPLTELQREHLSRIRSSSLHLLRLVEEVLDLSKIEAGQLVVEEGTHPITAAADLALSLVRPQAQARGVVLEDHCSERAGITFRGDPDRVRQILVNLLSNAIKFTEPDGNVVLDCDVVDRPPRGTHLGEGAYIFFTVADTGLGIAPDLLQRIFEPFERGEQGHTRRYGGSGLGLSISRRLARVMGGEITVSSQAGRGSTFTLWLPSGAAPKPQAKEARSGQPGPLEVSPHLLTAAGERLLSSVHHVQRRFIEAVRQDPRFDAIRTLPDAIVGDHATTLICDIATCLTAMPGSDRMPAPILLDGARIQRLISERHGDQRARFGLTAEAIRGEHQVLATLIEDVLRGVAAQLQAPASETEALLEIARSMVEQAEYSATLSARRSLVR